jgi:ribosomal protein S18 acetylase RimI-like enzyme
MALIRQYSPLDYPEIRKNLEEAGIFYEGRDSRENYNALAESDSGLILVAEKNEEVAGSLVAQQFGISLAFMWSGVVAEKYRRRGIATNLSTVAEHELRARGVREIWGFVDVANLASQALLKKFGFQTNEDHKYFGPWKQL